MQKRENSLIAVESTLGWTLGRPIEGLPCKNSEPMLSTVRIDPVT